MSQQRNLLSFFKRPAAAPAADDAEAPAPKRAAHAAADERPTPSRPAVTRDEAPSAGASAEAAPPCASPAEPPATAEPSAVRRAKAQRLLGAGAAPKANAAEAKIDARFSFLAEGAVRDAERRAPSHPQFDARTLYVPPSVKLSPSQQAYWDIKKNYADTVLFLKIGSFYELYEKDADVGVSELGWKMTLSGVGHCRQVGCPASGIDAACTTLVSRGYKVGRIEQLETGAQAKAERGPSALVRRELAEVQSAATALAGPALRADRPQLLLAIGERGAFCAFEAAAGRAYLGAVDTVEGDEGAASLAALLALTAPAEVLLPRGPNAAEVRSAAQACPAKPAITLLTLGAEFPPADDDAAAEEALHGAFADSPALAAAPPGAIAALAALRAHLARCRSDAPLLGAAELLPWSAFTGGALALDAAALAALEVLEGSAGGAAGSLLRRVDACASQPGRRLLRRWLATPLRSAAAIDARADAVDELTARPEAASMLRAALRSAPDAERALGRARAAAAPPPPGLPTEQAAAIRRRRTAALTQLATAARAGRGVLSSFASGGADGGGPPTSALLTALCSAAVLSPEAEAALEAAASFNVTAADADEEGADAALDAALAAAVAHGGAWGGIAAAAASLDVLCAFAAAGAAAEGPTCRARFVERTPGTAATLQLRGLWHPCTTGAAAPVGNDVSLGGEGATTMLLTGANNGGKSTLLRAVGVAVLLAHAGARVPASSATMSPCDRIYTRVGASDSLAAGRSTFLVEMQEAAAILRGATADSLVLADELGRGTATFDGFALASAALGALSDASGARPRCLFATHYHGLGALFAACPGVELRHMRCALRGGGDLDADDDDDADAAPAVAFLYALAPGVAPRSYGLHVASLAGLPKRLVRAAAERAAQLEARLAGAFAAASHADGALGADAAAALRAAVAATQPNAPPAALHDAWRDAVQLTL